MTQISEDIYFGRPRVSNLSRCFLVNAMCLQSRVPEFGVTEGVILAQAREPQPAILEPKANLVQATWPRPAILECRHLG